jgi:hypothetical protein
LECEYDIYDRNTWQQPRVEWKGEKIHEQVATADNVTPPPYYPDHPIVRKEWARYLNSVSGDGWTSYLVCIFAHSDF